MTQYSFLLISNRTGGDREDPVVGNVTVEIGTGRKEADENEVDHGVVGEQ